MGIQRAVEILPIAGDWLVLKIDAENAFNSVDRTKMLSASQSRSPHLYPFMHTCYSQHVQLYCQGTNLESQQGTHQGCALAGAGYAMAVHDVNIATLGTASGLHWGGAYLDDNYMIGPTSAVLENLVKSCEGLAQVNIRVKLSKCEAWGPGLNNPLLHSLPPSHPFRKITHTAFTPGSGIEILGSPVSHPHNAKYTRDFVTGVIHKQEELCTILGALPNPQMQHAILRSCADACRINHLTRSVPLTACTDLWARASQAERRCLEELLGVSVSDLQWDLATTPISLGGLGIKCPVKTAPSARLSAFLTFRSNAETNTGLPQDLLSQPGDIKTVLDRIGRSVGPGPVSDLLKSWNGQPLPSHADKNSQRQKWWAEKVAAHNLHVLKTKGTIRDQLKLQLQTAPHAAKWMSVTPSPNMGTAMGPIEYRLMLRWWLGAPILSARQAAAACPMCSQPLDCFGDHLVACNRNGIHARHTALQMGLSQVLRTAGIPHKLEVMGLGMDRPADLLLDNWATGQAAAVDLTISHPLAPSAYPLAPAGVAGHLATAEAAKMAKHSASCDAMKWHCTPMAFHPWCGLGPTALQTLTRVVKMATGDLSGNERACKAHEIWSSLSFTLARAVAGQLATVASITHAPVCDLPKEKRRRVARTDAAGNVHTYLE